MTNPLNSSNSTQSNNNEVNSLIREVNQMKEVQVFKDDSGTRRVLMGRGGNGFYGFKVSQEGFDVYDATDDELIFNSDNNIFKIAQQGTTTINVPNSSNDFIGEAIVTHDLGYVPAYIAFVIPPAGFSSAPANAQLPWFYYSLYDSANTPEVEGWHIKGLADVGDLSDTEISFRLSFVINSSDNVGDWTFKYFLLQETAN